jgi:hypothetical protein
MPQTEVASVERKLSQRSNEQAGDAAMVLPTRTVPAVPVPATQVLTHDQVPSTVPAVTVPAPTPEPMEGQVLPTIGSRAEVVFGRTEHIALLRTRIRSRARRRQGYGESVKRRVPVAVRDIPSLDDGEHMAQDGDDTSVLVSVPSLWDLLTTAPMVETNGATPSMLPATSPMQFAAHPHQSPLWD